jgi:hypothetical protein
MSDPVDCTEAGNQDGGGENFLLPLQGDEAGVSQSIALRLPNRLALQGQSWDGRDGDGLPCRV